MIREHNKVLDAYFQKAANGLLKFEQDNVFEIVDNPNQTKYPGQKIAIVEIDGYAFLVPYEQHGNELS